MAMKSSPRLKSPSVGQIAIDGPSVDGPAPEVASLDSIFETLSGDVADLSRVRDLSAHAAPAIRAFSDPSVDPDDRTFFATSVLMAEQASLTSEKDGQRGIGLGNSMEAMSLRYACRGEKLSLLEEVAAGRQMIYREPKPGITAERQASLALGALAQMGLIVRAEQIVDGAARFANSAASGSRSPLAHTFVRRRRAL